MSYQGLSIEKEKRGGGSIERESPAAEVFFLLEWRRPDGRKVKFWVDQSTDFRRLKRKVLGLERSLASEIKEARGLVREFEAELGALRRILEPVERELAELRHRVFASHGGRGRFSFAGREMRKPLFAQLDATRAPFAAEFSERSKVQQRLRAAERTLAHLLKEQERAEKQKQS